MSRAKGAATMPVLSNPRWESFCQAYVRGEHAGNATACYKEISGSAARTARQQAYKLLRRGDIVTRLAEIRAEIQAQEAEATAAATAALGITKEWVLGKLVENVERAMQVTAVIDEDGKPIGEYKYDGAVANKALELLGRYVGLFATATGDVTNNILAIGTNLIDRPPQETFKQWQERRLLELAPKTIEHTNGQGNGKAH
jgi:hypothetical protein